MSTQCASPNNKVDHNKDKDVNSDNSSSQKLSSSDSDSSEFGLGLKSGHPEDNFQTIIPFVKKIMRLLLVKRNYLLTSLYTMTNLCL